MRFTTRAATSVEKRASNSQYIGIVHNKQAKSRPRYRAEQRTIVALSTSHTHTHTKAVKAYSLSIILENAARIGRKSGKTITEASRALWGTWMKFELVITAGVRPDKGRPSSSIHTPGAIVAHAIVALSHSSLFVKLLSPSPPLPIRDINIYLRRFAYTENKINFRAL